MPDPNFFAGIVLLVGQEGEPAEITPRNHPFSVLNGDDSRGIECANYRGAGLADMAAVITEGRQHRCSLELATHVVEVVTAILSSAQNHSCIEMVTSCTRPEPLTPAQANALI